MVAPTEEGSGGTSDLKEAVDGFLEDLILTRIRGQDGVHSRVRLARRLISNGIAKEERKDNSVNFSLIHTAVCPSYAEGASQSDCACVPLIIARLDRPVSSARGEGEFSEDRFLIDSNGWPLSIDSLLLAVESHDKEFGRTPPSKPATPEG